jgi:hypothetical protein
MPANSQLTKSDPIIMTPIEINDFITDKLQKLEFYVKRGSKDQEVDLRAIKDDFELIIESRGNQAKKNKDTDLVFESSQLETHLSEHVTQIMRFQQSVSTDKTPIYIMANPDIPRLKERVAKIVSGLNKLEICRFWISEFDEITVDGPKELEKLLNNLLQK